MLKKVGDGIVSLKDKIFTKKNNNNNSSGNSQQKQESEKETDVLRNQEAPIHVNEGKSSNLLGQNQHQSHNMSTDKFIAELPSIPIQIGAVPANVQERPDLVQPPQAQQQFESKELSENNTKEKKGIINNVQQKIQEGRTAISAAVKNAIGQVNDIKKDVVQEYHKLGDRSAQVISKQKEAFSDWAKLKAEDAILKILKNQRPRLKRYLTDPYMMQVVKEIIHDMIDDNWPELEEYIRQQLRTSILSDKEIVIEEIPPKVFCLMQPWYQLRRWYLYTSMPYNKSFWHTIRSFSWWFFLLVKLFPWYGVQSYLYMLFFLMIDKSDEWQLLTYIVSFKRLQFFSFGVTSSLIGYAMFFNCATLNDYAEPNDFIRCKTEGPGSKINLVSDIIGFLIQVVFCWVSFMMIPFSETKGEFKYSKSVNSNNDKKLKSDGVQPSDQLKGAASGDLENQGIETQLHRSEQNKICCFTINAERGGRIKCFLIYDLIVFSMSLGLMLITIYAFNETEEDWQKYQLIYLIKTTYGFLNLPWLIFMFPPMLNLLTTARETGYDRYGVTQRMHVDYKDKIQKDKVQSEEKKGLLNQEMNLGDLVIDEVEQPDQLNGIQNQLPNKIAVDQQQRMIP